MSAEGQRAAEILEQAKRRLGVSALWRTGTALSYTDPDGYVTVALDGVEAAGATDDDTESVDDEPQLHARVLTSPVALDERVHTVATPDGGLYVIGSMGGQPRCVGLAAIAGGGTDVPIASTAATAIDNLRAEYTVTHPNHLFRIDVGVYLQSNGADNTLVGRVRREDEAGATVEVGRFLRQTGLALNATLTAGSPVFDIAPDPGTYIAFPSVQASVGGWTIIVDPSTTPLWAAVLSVTDCGPLPASTARS